MYMCSTTACLLHSMPADTQPTVSNMLTITSSCEIHSTFSQDNEAHIPFQF